MEKCNEQFTTFLLLDATDEKEFSALLPGQKSSCESLMASKKSSSGSSQLKSSTETVSSLSFFSFLSLVNFES